MFDQGGLVLYQVTQVEGEEMKKKLHLSVKELTDKIVMYRDDKGLTDFDKILRELNREGIVTKDGEPYAVKTIERYYDDRHKVGNYPRKRSGRPRADGSPAVERGEGTTTRYSTGLSSQEARLQAIRHVLESNSLKSDAKVKFVLEILNRN